MNWILYMVRALQLVPVIVAGIEHIHGEAPGATKKQMAMDALSLAYGGASALLPQDQPAIDAATQMASNVIDGTVAVFNQAGIFKGSGAVAAPKPVAPSSSVNATLAAPVPIAPAPPANLTAVNRD